MGGDTVGTKSETVVWAYDDMEAARHLWPRVKDAVEEQCTRERIEIDLGTQRRVIAATVNDLLEESKPEKRSWCAPKSISKLLHMFRKPSSQVA